MKFAIAIALNLLVVQAAISSAAQPAPPSREPGELRFRRVYIPEGAKDWSDGNVKYLPMDSREFERLLGVAQRTTPGLPAQSTAGLLQAQYEGRLKGQSLLQGSATLDVSPAIASSMLMTFDPCNLAIDRAQWVTSDGAPAELGMSGDGRLRVLAERGGQMKFDWSLAGQVDAVEGVTFAIALPPSPVSRLLLELPAEMSPTVDHGVASDEGPTDANFRRWKIDLGGWSSCRMRIAKTTNIKAPRQIVLGNQSTVYDFSLRGVEVAVQLDIGVHRDPLERITLALEPSSKLVEVAAGNQALAWSPAIKPGGKLQQIAVEIPRALQEGSLKLRFQAVSPLSMAESWKLPRLLVDGVVCRTNTVRLAVSSPLCIASLTPHGCRQIAVAPLKSVAGEQLDFDAYDADAGFEISLTQRAADVQAVSATATILGQGKMSSRVTADLRTNEGPLFALEADLLPRWTIDSVESQPADAIDDWTLENLGGKSKLLIRLAHPLSAEKPLRLIVSARRLYAFPGRNLNVDDVVPLRLAAPVKSRRLVDLRATGSNELRVKPGQRAWRADVNELTAAELDLFPEQPGDLLLHDDASAAALRFSLEPRKPTYDAIIRCQAILGGHMLEEDYTLICTPAKAAPIDRLVIHFSGHRDAPLKWTIAGLDEDRFTARRWTASQVSAAGLTSDEEAWDITFRNPQSTRIELQAVRRTKISGPTSLCLASLPDAAHQEATLIIRSLGPQAIQIQTHRLTPLPIETASAGQIQTVRAAYRYDPRAEATPQTEPAIVVTDIERESAAAWVSDCDILSQFAANGAGEHRISYKIENAGSRQVGLKLPSPMTRRDIHEITINNKPATALPAADGAADFLRIELPTDLKSIELGLQISTRGAPLATFHRVEPALPDIGLPIFARHWSVELPPGFGTLYDSRTANATEPLGLRARLLGCLGRGEGQKVFDPFRSGDWRNLLRWQWSQDRGDVVNESTETPGWSQLRMNLAGTPASVTVIHRATVDAAGWLLFLTVVGVGTWWRTGRPIVLVLMAVIFGTCALLLPAAIAVVFSRGLLGVMFCPLLKLVRLKSNATVGEQPSTFSREMPSTLTNIIPYAAPLLAAAMLCADTSAIADDAVKSSPTYSVFIPVNDKQEPTGGKYYVPEAFFSELYRRAAAQVEKPQGWMITSAMYRAALVEDSSFQGHVVDRLAVEYEIRVFNAAARVRIPLRRDEVSLVPGQAQLDDRPIQPDWEGDGSALLLDIAEPGEYRLELTLRPNVQSDSRGAGFDMAIPRVSGARLEVSVPPGGPAVEVASALGAVRWEEIPSRWLAELGPAERLAVRWQDNSTASSEPINVEQLQWLKIEPGCVFLNVRLKAKAAGQVRRLLLKADATLELLPDSSPAARPIVTRGDNSTQTIEIQLPPSAAAGSTLDLRFLCTGAASVGTFRAPQIDVVDSRPGRRWLAVSIDPSLEYQLSAARVQDTGAVPEFVSAWGTAEKVPDLAFRLIGNAAEWSMTTRPRKTEISGDQSVTWTFDTDSAQVEFRSELNTGAGSVFQWRLNAPPELQVDSAVVVIEGAQSSVRWAQNKDGRIAIFPSVAAPQHHTIIVRGEMRLPMKQKVVLPQIRLDDVHIQNSVVRLYRRESVLVDIVVPPGLAEVKSPSEDSVRADQGQLLRSFYVDPAETNPVSVTIQPNPTKTHSEAVIAPRQTVPQAPQMPAGETRIVRADVRFAWQLDGRRLGAASLDVESPAADYPLVLPEGFELLQLTVDGVPVDALRANDGTWTLPLSPHASKSRVELLYFANSANSPGSVAAANRVILQAPRLGDLPVESAVWTIASPHGLQAGSAEGEGNVAIAPAVLTDGKPSELVGAWRQFAEKCGSVVSYAVNDPAGAITVNFATTTSPAWLVRLVNVTGFLAAMALVAFLLRRGLITNWLTRWPHLFGVALGAAWWFWASPSALGLVIVLAVLGHRIFSGRLLPRAIAVREGVR